MKILLIRFGSMGDVILITPLIKAIKKSEPTSQIYVLVKDKYKMLLEHNRDIVGIISLDNNGLYGIIRQINKEKFDIILDLHNNIRSNLIKMFCNSNLKFTYKKNIFNRRLMILKSFINRNIKKQGDANLKVLGHNDFRNIFHSSRKYFEPIKHILKNVDFELKSEITITDKEQRFALKFLEDNKITKNDVLIGINPAGKNSTKRIEPDKYIELIKKIVKEFNAKIIIFGDSNDIDTVTYIEKGINNKNVINTAGKLDLLELAALIRHCKLFITGDTGPMHIANAFNVPVIAMFGPTVVEFGFYPIGINDVVLCLDLNCRPCSLHGNKECPIGTHDCMNKIDTKDIFKIINEKIITSQ
jgi:heptosyltransferase-2